MSRAFGHCGIAMFAASTAILSWRYEWDREGYPSLIREIAMAAPRKVAKESGQEKSRRSHEPWEFNRGTGTDRAEPPCRLIRRFEEKAAALREGPRSAASAAHLGQEAIVVGMQMALKKGDQRKYG